MKKNDTNKKDVQQKENKPKFGRQLVIGLYDLIIYTAVTALLLIIYDGSMRLNAQEVAYQYLLGGIFILIFRVIFKVYSQIWRYGGIQCFIRLLLADGCAFVSISS